MQMLTMPVLAGRSAMNSDWLFSLVQPPIHSPWTMAILDTGAPPPHILIDSDRVTAFDCVNGIFDHCRTGMNLNPIDDCGNHGTRTAAVLTGNSSLGNEYRGVTNFSVWSYKVYYPAPGSTPCVNYADIDAVVRGFQAATADLADIIVAEVQHQADDASATAVAADNAYNAGRAVIAANGNYGHNGFATVTAPADAHKAMGVGAVHVATLETEPYQGRGPAPDGRTKPDVQAPTNTTTASNAGFTALELYSGTSGSTPYAAGAAALLGYWRDPYGAPPAYVYTRLINWGNHFDAPATHNVRGAGLLALPSTNGTASWGSVYVTSPTSVYLTFTVPANASNLRAALWWAETVAQAHSDVDLFLYDPSGALRASSLGRSSIWEKTIVPGTVAAGNWLVELRGISTPAGSQRTYFDIHVQH